MKTEPGARGISVITGGSRGIGAAAVAAAHAGWSVLLTYHHDERAAIGVVERIQTAGGLASAIRADMANADDITAMFEAADALGTVTAFVANAGVAAPQSRVDELTAARIAEILAVNVAGPLRACGHAVRRMSTLPGGAGAGPAGNRRHVCGPGNRCGRRLDRGDRLRGLRAPAVSDRRREVM